jgi:hypothetical protein
LASALHYLCLLPAPKAKKGQRSFAATKFNLSLGGGLTMKIQKTILVGTLLLLSVAGLSAQNTLLDPNDDACWSSLAALRACELQAYDHAMDQAQRCTSYPEYQCLPATQQPEQKVSVNHSHQISKTAGNNTASAASPALMSPTEAPQSDSK